MNIEEALVKYGLEDTPENRRSLQLSLLCIRAIEIRDYKYLRRFAKAMERFKDKPDRLQKLLDWALENLPGKRR